MQSFLVVLSARGSHSPEQSVERLVRCETSDLLAEIARSKKSVEERVEPLNRRRCADAGGDASQRWVSVTVAQVLLVPS
jgi:hypothetical protein